MHGATEFGVWGGLFKIAEASRADMRIEKDSITVQEAVVKICCLYGIDPYSSISEGTLILTTIPAKTNDVLKALKDAGIPATRVGEVLPQEEGMIVVEGASIKSSNTPVSTPQGGFRTGYGRGRRLGTIKD